MMIEALNIQTLSTWEKKVIAMLYICGLEDKIDWVELGNLSQISNLVEQLHQTPEPWMLNVCLELFD